MNNAFNCPIITLGSPFGVGYEIFIKTVKTKKLKTGSVFAAGSKSILDFYLALYKTKLNYLFLKKNDLKNFSLNDKKIDFVLIDIDDKPFALKSTDAIDEKVDGAIALKSIETAAEVVKKGFFKSVVTLPVSKKNINIYKPDFMGHTEFFQKRWDEKIVFMTFISDKINILLLTTHLPLKSVAKAVTPALIKKGIETAITLKRKLDIKNKICLLGLNPHAGEEGILGKEELAYKKIIKQFSSELDGPIPADTAFTKENLKKYSLFISPYHDQGLIPFKMLSFHDGVNLSFGMKYIRTSVDHGTAVGIVGKNKADIKSFVNAYKLAVQLS